MDKSPVAFLNGEYLPLPEARVGIMTHALHYGTAAFEGIRGNWNPDTQKLYVFKLREHYERLLQGCKLLWIDLPYSIDELCEITIQVLERSGFQEDVYIRPMAFKSEERVANLNLRSLKDGFFCLAVPFGNYLDSDSAINCCVSSWRRTDDTMVPPRFKLSGIYLNNILAKTEALASGFDEAIMLNQDGHVCEGTGENIFLVYGNKLVTPTLESNVLPGITRSTIITLAREEMGLIVEERLVDRSELYIADEIFLSGTAAHIQGVGTIDGRPLGDGKIGPMTQKFQEFYFGIVRGNNNEYLHMSTIANPAASSG